MSDPTPVVAQTTPIPVEVEAGKSYFWCACGRSQRQPFCDGSHRDTPFQPVKWEAPETRRVWFCGCKHSGTAPVCDGTHKSLAGG